MDCKVPLEEGDGTLEFRGQLSHVEFIGHLCTACWKQRESAYGHSPLRPASLLRAILDPPSSVAAIFEPRYFRRVHQVTARAVSLVFRQRPANVNY